MEFTYETPVDGVIDIYKYDENGTRMVRMTEAHFSQFIADVVRDAWEQGRKNEMRTAS